MSKRINTLKCGCVARLDREAWESLCVQHEAEWQETHARWEAERRANQEAPIAKAA